MRGTAGFITHAGKRLYFIDAEGCSVPEILRLADQVERDVRSQPRASVLTLTHVKDVALDHRVTERLRTLTDGNRPFVKASAISGLSLAQRIVFNTVRILARRDFKVFDRPEDAKDFLAKLP